MPVVPILPMRAAKGEASGSIFAMVFAGRAETQLSNLSAPLLRVSIETNLPPRISILSTGSDRRILAPTHSRYAAAFGMSASIAAAFGK